MSQDDKPSDTRHSQPADDADRAHGKPRVRRSVVLSAVFALAMLGFGYAMVPLYDLFCEVTGFGGRVVAPAEVESTLGKDDAVPARPFSLRLSATVGSVGRFDFSAPAEQLSTTTGEFIDFVYTVTNKSSARVVGQAIPSVVPAEASQYVKKVECFCFAQQVLDPHQTMELPVRLYVDKRLPGRIGEVTLSYVYYDSSEQNPDLLKVDHSLH